MPCCMEAGRGTSPSATRFRPAFNITPPLSVRRLAVTATTFRAAFGCMWAAEGVSGNINTANYFLNKTRAWKTRTQNGHSLIGAGPPNEMIISSVDTQDSVYFPSVTTSPNDSSPGAGDGWYAYAFQVFAQQTNDLGGEADTWTPSIGEATDYNGVQVRTDFWLTQNVDSGTWTDAAGGPIYTTTWSQTLSNEDSASGCVSDLRTFLASLNITGVWGASPPTIYQQYEKNVYCASIGDWNNPSFSSLASAYTDLNCDITNLSSDRTTFANYPYDAVYYPIPNLSGYIISPGAFGSPFDVGTSLGIGSINIAGDVSRCRVGFVGFGSNTSPNGSTAAGSGTPLCDRIQYQSENTIHLTIVELGYAYGNGIATLTWFVKHVSETTLYPGAIYEIPQSSFTGPAITTQGGADYCLTDMDSVMLINSDITTFAAAIGATVVSAW